MHTAPHDVAVAGWSAGRDGFAVSLVDCGPWRSGEGDGAVIEMASQSS